MYLMKKKKSTFQWTCALQTCAVQESTTLKSSEVSLALPFSATTVRKNDMRLFEAYYFSAWDKGDPPGQLGAGYSTVRK